MTDMKETSWQQRYGATLIYTLRCKALDKPGMFSKLSSCIGEAGANLGEIKTIDLESQYKIRDVTVYLNSMQQYNDLLKFIKETDGIDVIGVTDEVMETHRRGSIEIVSKAKIQTLTDLRMVYTPGVANVCNTIVDDPEKAWEFTGICDRVAIITNGTAVLGLGDIGPLASLPVMEGKASIFAEFAGISAFPILIDTKDVDTFVDTVVRTASCYGAIQLEDVAAPACFEIEEKLMEKLDMPIFHDDQHGTATVVLAALINALKVTNKNPKDCRVIMLGGGSAGIAISYILLDFGVKDVIVFDSKGAIYPGRKENMNPYKEKLAEVTNKKNIQCSLAEGFKGSDIFIGVSRPHMVTKEMIGAMNPDSIVLPLSNPIGEISKEEAVEAGAAIAADGRDINNALAYPGIFRGALDIRAKAITMEMKIAAAQKLAEIAPKNALLPSMLNRNVHKQVADAVAKAWK